MRLDCSEVEPVLKNILLRHGFSADRAGLSLADQIEIPDLLNGSSRIRVPVAANIALVIAGAAGAIGGSPRPVGELSLWMK